MKLMARCGHVLLLLLAVWVCGLILLAVPVIRSPSATPSSVLDSRSMERLSRAFSELDLLKKQHSEMRTLLSSINVVEQPGRQEDKDALYQEIQEKLHKVEFLLDQPGDVKVLPVEQKDEPSTQYEQTRRRIASGVQEMWFYVGAELRKLLKQLTADDGMAERISQILEQTQEHQRSIMADIESLTSYDGYEDWREREADELSDLVQRRLHYLQNPPDCSTARKLVCSLNKGCGYGCQLHHAVYCFLVAYGTQRTLILKSKGWRYHKAGWEEVFLPVSDTCTDPGGSSQSHWPGKPNIQVVDLPIVDSLFPRPPYLPQAVPSDLAPRLTRLHGDPAVWWVGQFLKYLLRPQESTDKMLKEAASRLKFENPIVGVHVRRTDKIGTEAAFHPIEEYMSIVEDYYELMYLKTKVPPKRRVYLASDDPKVLNEARTKYPQYQILGDPSIAKTAGVATRYSDNSLNGIIIDIHFLANSDFLVCTFSSQVCRVAYELMQTKHPDAASRFRSLDDIYYYGGQAQHSRIAILPHKPKGPKELELNVGDLVGVAGNHWDGWSKGKSVRTGLTGLYPSFKVEQRVDAVDFPVYPEVPLKKHSGVS